MKFGSTAKNINLLTLLVTVIAVLGLLNTSMFTLSNILLSIGSFYILNILGIWMTLHRYYSHKSFNFRYLFLKYIFTLIAILAGRGSPLGWVYLHRQHHAYSDTEKDPHSPKNVGYKLFGFQHYKKQEEHKMQLFLIKDMMSKTQLFIHNWYILVIATFVLLLAIINIEILYFGWILPALFIQFSQSNFNYFGHTYGYINYKTDEDSKNNIFLFPIILGEAWHNNHHGDPKNMSTTVRRFELDPLSWFITLIKK
jgi:stearoyl-CoA desaturase (delta-9 desaturase)